MLGQGNPRGSAPWGGVWDRWAPGWPRARAAAAAWWSRGQWATTTQRGQDGRAPDADHTTDASGRLARRTGPRDVAASGNRPLGADAGRASPDALGDMDEFEAFFRRHERQVVACLWRITGDEQTAHDLSQETFLRAWRHFAQVRGYEQPGAWLLRVATNLALNELRRRSVPTAAAERFADDDAPGALASSDPNLRLAERDLVEQTLLELTPQQRAALALREVYGFTCEEIGRTLGVSRDAIKMTLWRAREQFRLHYLRKGGWR